MLVNIARRLLPVSIKKRVVNILKQVHLAPQHADIIERTDAMIRLLEQQQIQATNELAKRITLLEKNISRIEQCNEDSIERTDILFSDLEQESARIANKLQSAIESIRLELNTLHAARPGQEHDRLEADEKEGAAEQALTFLRRDEYFDFQSLFRGPPNDLEQKLLRHVSWLKGANKVLDVACGRGEFLELLRAHEIAALGVEINDEAVEIAREKGLNVIKGDYSDVLESFEPGQVSAISALHFVEHLDRTTLRNFLEQCYRILPKKGLLLVELPNIRSINTLTQSYYLDPTHKQPLDVRCIEFVLNKIGFRPVETEFINDVSLNQQLLENVQPSMDTLKVQRTPWETRIIEVMEENSKRLNKQFYQGLDVVIRAYKE